MYFVNQQLVLISRAYWLQNILIPKYSLSGIFRAYFISGDLHYPTFVGLTLTGKNRKMDLNEPKGIIRWKTTA
jgi:hypothetical protein